MTPQQEQLILSSGGDNLQTNPLDYELAGDIAQKIDSMPSVNNENFRPLTQNTPEFSGSCTLFGPYNAITRDFGLNQDYNDIRALQKTASLKGFSNSTGWYRAGGVNENIKFFEKKGLKLYSANIKIFDFVSGDFTPEFLAWGRKNRSCIISIKVDINFMRDARDNFFINSNSFSRNYGHCDMGRYIQALINWEMIDSAFGHPNYKYKIEKNNFVNLIRKGNIINEATIIFQENNFLEDEKNIIMLKNLGITDGKNLDHNMTLAQAIVLAYRIEKKEPLMPFYIALQGGKKYLTNPSENLDIGITREKLAWILSKMSKISYEDLITRGVWSGNNAKNIATRFEGLLMIGRLYKILNG